MYINSDTREDDMPTYPMFRAFSLSPATIVLLASLCPPLAAQECVDLARVIGREAERVGDRAAIAIQNKASLCSQRYEMAGAEQRANIEAAYGLFSGGASGSSSQIQELQQAQCENHYGAWWSSQQHSTEINRVSELGADVIRACLSGRSFRLTNLQFVGDAVNATFLYGGVGEIKVSGVIVTPPQIARCSVFVNGAKQDDLSKLQGVSLNSGENLTLACQRQPVTPTGSPLHFEGGIIGIATASDTPTVPLIAHSKLPISDEFAPDLSARLSKLEEDLRTWDPKGDSNAFMPPAPITIMPPQNHVPDHWTTANCPQGYYMIGMSLFTDTNESFLQRAQVLCRPLIPR
jgi:hypothetical protein